MNAKRVALISVAALAAGGGTYALIRNRKRSITYNAILGKIIQASPIQNPNWTEYFEPSYHTNFDPAKYRKYTTAEKNIVAEELESGLYGEWYELGFGTRFDIIRATMTQIPDGVRLSQVSEAYQNKYGQPLYAALLEDLNTLQENEIAAIVSRKKPSSQI